LLHNLPGRVHLIKIVLEDVLLAELLHEGLSFPQLVKLATGPLKELRVYRKQGPQKKKNGGTTWPRQPGTRAGLFP
jgi:hypothetical protein